MISFFPKIRLKSTTNISLTHLQTPDEPSIEAAAKEAKSLFSQTENSHLRLAFALPGILHAEKSPVSNISND